MTLIKSIISANDIYSDKPIILTLLGSSAANNRDSYIKLYGDRINQEAISQDDVEVDEHADAVLNSHIDNNSTRSYGTYFLGGKL